jgi:hypothetical protein
MPNSIDGEPTNFHCEFSKTILFQVYYFSCQLCQPKVFNKDPTVWLDVVRPPPRYVSKFIKIIITIMCINNIWFNAKLFSDGNWQIVLNGESCSYSNFGTLVQWIKTWIDPDRSCNYKRVPLIKNWVSTGLNGSN